MDYYTNVTRLGNKIAWTGYNEHGEKFYRKDHFTPTLYTKTNSKDAVYKTIFDEPLEPTTFESMSAAKAFIDTRKNSNVTVYGNTNYVSQFICDRFPDGFDHIDTSKVNICLFDLEMIALKDSDPFTPSTPYTAISSGFPHPEKAEIPIVSGAFYFTLTNEVVILGLNSTYQAPTNAIEELGKEQPVSIRYIRCIDEKELLKNIIDLFTTHQIDVLSGWNSRTFDVPYLIRRIDVLFEEGYSKHLSPWKRVNEKKVFIKGKEYLLYEIAGIAQLDYLDIFKKFSANTFGQLENYRLDTVANVVLGDRKLDYSEYSNLNELYNKDYQKFIDYNLKDTILLLRLERQIRYLDIALMISYKTGINYEDVLGTISSWDTYIYRELLNKEYKVIPPQKAPIKEQYDGGYVKDPLAGLYDWVASVDLASLYPNTIIQYNMSPETLVENERNEDASVENILSGKVKCNREEYAMAANGAYFRKDFQGVIPRLIEGLYTERKQAKKKMLEAKSLYEEINDELSKKETKVKIDILSNKEKTIKVMMNSLYGALGSPYFRFFSKPIAEGITLSGQLTIKWAERESNKFFNKVLKTDSDYVIAIDTDSCYLNFSPLVNEVNPKDPLEFVDRVCKDKLEPLYEKSYDVLFRTLNGFKNRMVLEREKIGSGVFVAKKRYFFRVLDDEGVRYKDPKIKITGIEAIKSSTPKVMRDGLKEAFKYILEKDKDKLNALLEDVKNKVLKEYSIEEIAVPRSANNLDKYSDSRTIYKKGGGPGCPIAVRASLLYNHWIKKKGIDDTYHTIESGDKMLWCYLRMPNTIHENVIGFVDVLPKELGLHEYVDRQLILDKSFSSVLNPILDLIQWSDCRTDREESLDDFFC